MFDYDFTTVDKEEGVPCASPKTIESLERLKENGYLTMLCSGRSKRFLEEDVDKFQGAITCNGAYMEINGDVIRDIHISEEDDLLDFLNGQTDSPLKDFEESMKFALADSTMNIYYFNTLEEVAAAARLIRNYETRSSLYKDPDSHYYYLILSSVSNDASDSVMEEIHSILAEYCRRLPNTYATKSLFNEHLKPLIQARAVEEMSQY